MARNKDRDPSEMILGTFRVKSGIWEQFKQLASDNNATATDLILSFIENCLQSQSIPHPQSNLDVIPQSNLDDIYTYIDSKLDKTLSIQQTEDLIDSRIGGSIQTGDIKGAIAHSYKSSVDQFNEMICELQNQIGELKKQVQELQSISPSTAPIPPSADIENLLGIGDILAGSPYDLNYLNVHIGDKLNEHKSQIEAALKIKLNLADPKYICREFNKIVRGLGYEIKNKQINKVETYWIETNNDKVPK